LRNRSWAFLFDNLRRNIDEIYQICESDENVYECKVSNLYNHTYFTLPWVFSHIYIYYINFYVFFRKQLWSYKIIYMIFIAWLNGFDWSGSTSILIHLKDQIFLLGKSEALLLERWILKGRYSRMCFLRFTNAQNAKTVLCGTTMLPLYL